MVSLRGKTANMKKSIGLLAISLATILSSCNKESNVAQVPDPVTNYDLYDLSGWDSSDPTEGGVFGALQMIERNDSGISIVGNFAYGFVVDSIALNADSVMEANFLNVGSVHLNDVKLNKNNENIYAYSYSEGKNIGIPLNFSSVWEIGDLQDTSFYISQLSGQPDVPIVSHETNFSLIQDFEAVINDKVNGATNFSLLVKSPSGLKYYTEFANSGLDSVAISVSSDTLQAMGRGEYSFFVSAYVSSEQETLPEIEKNVAFRNQSVYRGTFVFK
ncbi:MAG: hypothetical protein ACI9YL_000321 [Luteibaculaceae bacterium]